jgi:alkylation response protein AidB-like acyl-CoA dehydrogenase
MRDLDAELGEFRTALRSMLRARGVSRLTRDCLWTGGFDAELWSVTATNLGVQGLLIPAGLGGAGADLAAAAVAVEELESSLAPGPFRACLAATVALGAAPGLADDVLSAIAAGTAVVTFAAVPAAGGEVQVVDGRLDGTLPAVPHAGHAGLVVVLLPDADGATLCVLELDRPEMTGEPLRSLDITRPARRVHCSSAPVRATRLTPADTARVVDAITVLTAAEQVGVIGRVVADTVDYCRERFAFGRSVASFQGMKHQLAQLHCSAEQAVALLDEAIEGFGGDPARRRLRSLALRCYLGPLTVRVATEGLRLRGGIGYTWEYDSHLYFRRARALEHHLGDPYAARDELARELALV